MLTTLVITLMSQSPECRFHAAWWLSTPVSIHSARGEWLGVLPPLASDQPPAATADVLIREDGAVVELRHRGTRLSFHARELPVTLQSPPAFGHGYSPTSTSLFRVQRVDGAFVEVVPWTSDDVTVHFTWKPRRVACSELRLGAATALSPLCSETEPLVDIASTRGGPTTWRVRTTALEVSADGRAQATLVDGSVVRGWSKRGPMLSGAVGVSTICAGPPIEKQSCRVDLPLLSRGGDVIGTLQAEMPFTVTDSDDQRLELQPDGIASAVKLFVQRSDFARCTP